MVPRLRFMTSSQNERGGQCPIDEEHVDRAVLPNIRSDCLKVGDDLLAEPLVKLPEGSICFDVAVIALWCISNYFVGTKKALEAATIGRAAWHFGCFVNQDAR